MSRTLREGFKSWFFFVPWLLISLAVLLIPLRTDDPIFEQFVMLDLVILFPFVIFGLMGLTTPYWLRRNARSTVYAVTNRRALVIKYGFLGEVKSYWPLDIPTVALTLYCEGIGDVVLWSEEYCDQDGERNTRTEGFFDIEGAQHVARLMEKLVEAVRGFGSKAVAPLGPQ
jgi:hypothetical protein